MGLFSPDKKDVIMKIPSIYQIAILEQQKAQGFMELSVSNIGLSILALGSIVFATRLLIQFISFYRMRSAAKLIIDAPVRVYQVDKNIVPFSFANSIFINPGQHAEEDIKEIIRHEFIHVKQKHSVDMIIGEIVCLLNWFNPFAWLIRQSIRQNLEFIADEQVLQQGFDKKQYQYLLLKVIGVPQFSIASNFNFTSLKKRIAMMNKNKSAKLHLSRFLLLLPIVLILLVAFRKVQQPVTEQAKISMIDTVPMGKVDPNDIQNIDINKNGNKKTITIRLKSGVVDQYDLNDPKQKAALEKKYGKIQDPPPPPPPPVPPTPPAPGVKSVPAVPEAPGAKSVPPVPEVPGAKSIPPAQPVNAPVPPVPPVPPAKKKGEQATISIRSSNDNENVVMQADSIVIREAPINQSGEPVRLSLNSNNPPLLILDGKEQPIGTDIKKLVNPEDIESVNVLKDGKATEAYGDKGKNGVIIIVSKK